MVVPTGQSKTPPLREEVVDISTHTPANHGILSSDRDTDLLNSAAGAQTSAHSRRTRPMTQLAKSQEPSMEEILASIRRHIADEGPAKESAPNEALGGEPPRSAAPPIQPHARGAASGNLAPAMCHEEISAKLAELREMSQQTPSASAEASEPSTRTAVVGSNAQCEQFNEANPDHQHGECYWIIVEPIAPWMHDTPPCSRFISRTGRQKVQMLVERPARMRCGGASRWG